MKDCRDCEDNERFIREMQDDLDKKDAEIFRLQKRVKFLEEAATASQKAHDESRTENERLRSDRDRHKDAREKLAGMYAKCLHERAVALGEIVPEKESQQSPDYNDHLAETEDQYRERQV